MLASEKNVTSDLTMTQSAACVCDAAREESCILTVMLWPEGFFFWSSQHSPKMTRMQATALLESENFRFWQEAWQPLALKGWETGNAKQHLDLKGWKIPPLFLGSAETRVSAPCGEVFTPMLHGFRHYSLSNQKGHNQTQTDQYHSPLDRQRQAHMSSKEPAE